MGLPPIKAVHCYDQRYGIYQAETARGRSIEWLQNERCHSLELRHDEQAAGDQGMGRRGMPLKHLDQCGMLCMMCESSVDQYEHCSDPCVLEDPRCSWYVRFATCSEIVSGLSPGRTADAGMRSRYKPSRELSGSLPGCSICSAPEGLESCVELDASLKKCSQSRVSFQALILGIRVWKRNSAKSLNGIGLQKPMRCSACLKGQRQIAHDGEDKV